MNALDALRETTAALACCKMTLEIMALPNNPEDTRRAAAAQLVPVNDALALARAAISEADQPAVAPARNDLAAHLFDLGCSINRLRSDALAPKP
jgi:hypothetical protein